MFEKLEVYQRSVDFADKIAALTETFPRGYGFLVDQLNRAAVSIATNLAEGNGRFTGPTAATFSPSREGPPRNAFPCWRSRAGAASLRKWKALRRKSVWK